MSTSPLAVVLVHGAWHGPWCWDPVQQELLPRGLSAVAPALPSTCGDPAALGGFDDDVAAVRAALDDTGPAVVCAHSYGGLVVGAATHPALRHLVFVSAFMADEGEDWSAVATGPESGGETGALASALSADAHGNIVVDPDRATEIFYADCDPVAAADAVARLTPQNGEPFVRAMPEPAWRSVPSTFVVCENDRAITPARQRALAARAGGFRSLPTSHAAMLARPDLVADVLEGAARQHEGRATG